jgi:hypothetical protein
VESGGEAVVAEVDGFSSEVAGGFVAGVLVVEGVVGADFAGGLEVEEFVVVFGVGESADEVEVESEAVDGFHAEGGVEVLVVGVFDPAGEGFVELAQRGDGAEVADEELFADGAEEAFDLAFGGSVADGGVDEDGAEA